MSYSYYTQAALIADSLSLATHWVYNQNKIGRMFPDGVKVFHAPLSNYHEPKSAGDFTHYGDQTVWLADFLKTGAYEEGKWKAYWLDQMKSYGGYLDGASRATIENEGILPSGSNDLAGAARIAPLLDQKLGQEELVAAARSQTGLTHGDMVVVEAAEFFVRAVKAVENGASFVEALQRAGDEGSYRELPVKEDLEKAMSLQTEDHLKAGAELGLTCHTHEAFPLALYYLIHFGEDFEECMSMNALAGGDNSARAMLMALLFAARKGGEVSPLYGSLNMGAPASTEPSKKEFTAGSHEVKINSKNGQLAAVLEYPDVPLKAVALFAHCFTCGKDFLPGVRITRALAKCGIATLRVDFSGIGTSEGDFGATSFLTNLEELYTADAWLAEQLSAPEIMIGHSLGGAAAYAAAGDLKNVKAVVSIGAPADPGHVVHLFEDYLEEIDSKGVAVVKLAGRTFNIGKKFIEDMKNHDQGEKLKTLNAHKLVMHAPDDETVSLENAGQIYSQLTHPKSFVSLAGADHLLTKSKDSQYVAKMIAVWVERALS